MIHTLQVLRLGAALLVVFAHVEERIAAIGATFDRPVLALGFDGNLGVRIFFVISGFLMFEISQDRFGKSGSWWRFLMSRVLRIAPLYWALLAAKVVLVSIAVGVWAGRYVQPLHLESVVKSFLFIPYADGLGKHRPLLGNGWTLNYEMWFCVLFSAGLLFTRRVGAWLVVGVLSLLALGGLMFPLGNGFLGIISNWIIVGFAAGIVLAMIRARLIHENGRLLRLGNPYLLPLFLIVVSLYVRPYLGSDIYRTCASVLFVACCVLVDDRQPQSAFDRYLIRLAEQSYSLYLTHGGVLLIASAAWVYLFDGRWLSIYALISVPASVVVAYCVYRWVEQPSLRLSRSVRRQPRRDMSPRPAWQDTIVPTK